MTSDVHPLISVYKGWDGYQVSLVHAIAPLSREQLSYRLAPHLRSAGEIARHISEGRFGWFRRTFGVSSSGDANLVVAWRPEDAIEEQPAELVKGLEVTWRMIEDALNCWTVADLPANLPGEKLRRYPKLTQIWTCHSQCSVPSSTRAVSPIVSKRPELLSLKASIPA